MKAIKTFLCFLFFFSLCCCVPEEIVLHGDITGYVKDDETSEPLDSATINLIQSDAVLKTTQSAPGGAFSITNIPPGHYQLEAEKEAYKTITQHGVVTSTNTTEINFALQGIPVPEFSDTCVDFELDYAAKFFTITNRGAGRLRYSVAASQEWITVNPISGEILDEFDTIRVQIDRTQIHAGKQKAEISIISYIGDEIQEDIVDVLVNGVMDQEGNLYNIVRIGTQIWMAENLNAGVKIDYRYDMRPVNNGTVEKFCYDDSESNCDIYGGLYTWSEAMYYEPPDNVLISNRQGICPVNWHIPTENEWNVLIEYLGGNAVAGGKLKDTISLWEPPNTGATNETGFSALPAGDCNWLNWPLHTMGYRFQGETCTFWTSEVDWVGPQLPINSKTVVLDWDDDRAEPFGAELDRVAVSVRCIKDP